MLLRHLGGPLAAALLAAALSPAAALAGAAPGSTTVTQTTPIFVGDDGVVYVWPHGVAVPEAGAAEPYGAQLDITHDARITSARVTFRGVHHNHPDQLEILLVAPDGERVVLMNGAGGDTGLSDSSFTFANDGSPLLADEAIVPGTTYAPASHGPIAMTAPAPSQGAGASLSALVGARAGGTWQLFVYDDAVGGGAGMIGRIELHLRLGTAPYPSEITVSGVGTLTDVDVHLDDLSSTWPDDLDLLLVGPQGQRATLMSDAGGDIPTPDPVDLTFDVDATASGPVPDRGPLPAAATYQPADYDDFYPDTGMAVEALRSLDVFDGTPGNGVWRLYAVDDEAPDVTSIGGWSLDLEWDDPIPTGSLTVAGGATAVTTTAVTLSLEATNAGTGVTAMRFSNDGRSWSAYQPYATTAAWNLAAGDGTKTVHAQFRDGAGNQSAVVTDTVVLDATAPTATSIAPRKNATGVKPKTKVKVVASEALDPASVTKRTVTLKKGSTKVRATVALKRGVKIVLTPRRPLKPGTYTATVSTRVRDRVGHAFDGSKKRGTQVLTWRFRV